MGDAPPPCLAPRGRPTLITDLPTDVLSYIISIPFPGGLHADRVRLSVVCRAFADAVRPPSAVWEDVHVVFAVEDDVRGLREQYNTPSQQGAYGTLERAMQVAGPCVRRFSFFLDAKKLSSIDYEDMGSTRAWVERVLATTPRVHYAKMDYKVVVDGPPPMISAGRAAILDFWIDYKTSGWDCLDAALALHRRLVAVGRQAGSGAARTVPVLTSMEHWDMTMPFLPPALEQMDVQRLVPFIRSLAADVGQHLTRLCLSGLVVRMPPLVVPACVDHLPALRELHVGWWDHDDPLDLRRVVTPPRGLTCLVVESMSHATALLPPSIMSRLEVMGLTWDEAREPPACLRDAGNSFRRLTRLVYGGFPGDFVADLAWWATPAFAVPTLVVLEVNATSFTLRAADGPAWAATVASTTLPRLERLQLYHCGKSAFLGNRLMPADAVAEAITHSLPVAAAAAGRRLSVPVLNRPPSDTVSKQVNPQVERFVPQLLALKYEARPVQ